MPAASPLQASSASTSSSGEILSQTNLYIRGLPPDTTDKDLLALCEQNDIRHGKIISTKAIIDQNTGKCKGYGFIDYETAEAAEAAVKALQLKGVQVQMAKQQEQDTTNLYVANLPSHISETDLEQLFSSYGAVISTRILRDPNGISRGVGFARMESKDKCEAVIQAFNGTHLPGCKEAVTAKFADGGNRKKLQQKQWAEKHQEAISIGAFDHLPFIQNGLPGGLITPICPTVPRFAVGLQSNPAALNGFHLPLSSANWSVPQYQYVVVPTSIPTGSVPVEQAAVVPQVPPQVNQYHLSPQTYLPAGTTFIQMPYSQPTTMGMADYQLTNGFK